MGEGQEVLRAVLTAPAGDAPRLVYADWLDEHGDPDRAAFIRTQVELELAVTGPTAFSLGFKLLARQQELLTANAARWFGRLFPGRFAVVPDDRKLVWESGRFGPIEAILARGFVRTVKLPMAAFLPHAAALFAAQPVVSVHWPDRRFGRLAAGPGEETWDVFGTPGGPWAVYPEPGGNKADAVPRELWDLMAAPAGSAGVKAYSEAHLPYHALSDAAVTYGRRLNGLPDVPL